MSWAAVDAETRALMAGRTGDRIRVRGAARPCDFGHVPLPLPIDRGNIDVHQAAP